ncbi:hypothetical protein CEXT_14721 [Caerostris extrusa]|uniref:Uncharacterized protein n=1 Tax=Caerostris extrusa TaxID=172846 RepID=A0AAV4YA06_CAEEX|nr:hypothetical protein CEXT_14721 [Caerostris extrusa]
MVSPQMSKNYILLRRKINHKLLHTGFSKSTVLVCHGSSSRRGSSCSEESSPRMAVIRHRSPEIRGRQERQPGFDVRSAETAKTKDVIQLEFSFGNGLLASLNCCFQCKSTVFIRN